jgi:flagellin-specific chaperone FliS
LGIILTQKLMDIYIIKTEQINKSELTDKILQLEEYKNKINNLEEKYKKSIKKNKKKK